MAKLLVRDYNANFREPIRAICAKPDPLLQEDVDTLIWFRHRLMTFHVGWLRYTSREHGLWTRREYETRWCKRFDEDLYVIDSKLTAQPPHMRDGVPLRGGMFTHRLPQEQQYSPPWPLGLKIIGGILLAMLVYSCAVGLSK